VLNKTIVEEEIYWEELKERASGEYSPYDYIEDMEDPVTLNDEKIIDYEWE